MKKTLLASIIALGMVVGNYSDSYSQSRKPRYSGNNETPHISLNKEDIADMLHDLIPQYDKHRIDSTINRVKGKNELKFDSLAANLPEYKDISHLLKLYVKSNVRQESVTIRKNPDGSIIDSVYFDSNATSRSNARGYFQFKEKWWPAYGTNNFDDAYDPAKNMVAGLNFTKWLWEHLSQRVPNWNKKSDREKLAFMAAAHNGGTGGLREAGYDISKMGKEPRNHARRILQYYDIYNAEEKIMKAYDGLTATRTVSYSR